MNQETKKAKYKVCLKSVAVLLLLVFVFNFIAVPSAQAQSLTANADRVLQDTPDPGTWAVITLWGINAILTAVVYFEAVFLRIAGALFDASFENNFTGFFKYRAVITSGWTISRDVANMFFIFILLFIAIATILRFGSYNAKNLLPKLIIMALVINFSMVIGLVIIDFTNMLASGFHAALVGNQTDGISGALANATGINTIFDLKNSRGSSSSGWGGGFVSGVISGLGSGVIPQPAIQAMVNILSSAGSMLKLMVWDSKQPFQDAQRYFYVVLMSAILAFPLLFVFVFGGILLIMRFAMLLFMLILAPIAFLAYILPDTEGRIWKKWWDVFLNNAFFMPAFMFLLYLSLTIIRQWAMQTAGPNVQIDAPFIVTLIVSTVFLIGSLLISKHMGIYGAQKVLQTATKARQYATGYVGAMALRNTVGRAGEYLQQKEAVQRSYVGSRLARGMTQYKGAGIFAKPGQSREEVAGKRAKFDIESTFNKAPSEWHKDFANNKNYAYREAFARDVMGSPKRLEQFMKNADAGIKGDMLNIVRLKLGAEAEKTFQKAERTNERGVAFGEGKSIGSFMDGISGDEARQRQHFTDLNARDQAELFSQWQADPTKHALVQNWVKTELKPEDQEKFFVEGIRKATSALKGEMFNGLAQDRQNKVIESMSPREVVEMRQNAGAHMAVVENAIGRMPTDKQERIREEEARGLVKDLDKVYKGWGAFTEEQKKATSAVLSRDELQKVANNVADKDKFVDDIQKHAPNKTADVMAVLPEFASKIGKNPEDVVDWEKVSSKNPNLKTMMKKVQGKGARQIMARGDTVATDYVTEINSLGDNTDDIADALEKKHGNSGMATMLKLNPQMQQLVILPQKRMSRKAVSALQEEAMDDGTPPSSGGAGGTGKKGGGGGMGGSGGAAPASGGSTIIMPSSGFGGGPKTLGTSGKTPPPQASPSVALPTDISSPSVKAGYPLMTLKDQYNNEKEAYINKISDIEQQLRYLTFEEPSTLDVKAIEKLKKQLDDLRTSLSYLEARIKLIEEK